MTSLAHSPTNDTRRSDLMNEVRSYGRAEAEGKDALPMLALKVAYASADGFISGTKDADGADDYSKIYAEYAKARAKKAVHEQTPGGLKAQVSKLRQIGTAAAMPTNDFYASINAAITKRDELIAAKEKVRPCYHMIVELARTQIDQPDDLTPEQIEEAARKPDSSEKSLEGELKRMHKIAEDLTSGEKSVTCTDQWLVDIKDQLASQLTTFAVNREKADFLAKAAELGYAVAQPVTPEVTEQVAA